MAGDLGAQWDSAMGFKVGVSAQNLGGQLAGADLPMAVAAGAAYAFGGTGGKDYTLALDADMPSHGDVTVGVGGEAWINPALALRVGYHSNDVATNDLAVSGLTAGLGIKAGWLNVDYAYRALGDLGQAHQFSLLTEF